MVARNIEAFRLFVHVNRIPGFTYTNRYCVHNYINHTRCSPVYKPFTVFTKSNHFLNSPIQTFYLVHQYITPLLCSRVQRNLIISHLSISIITEKVCPSHLVSRIPDSRIFEFSARPTMLPYTAIKMSKYIYLTKPKGLKGVKMPHLHFSHDQDSFVSLPAVFVLNNY